MYMQMKYRLPTVRARIGDETVAALGDSLFFCKFARDGKDVTHKLFILHIQRADRLDVLVRYQQDVRWRDWTAIPKGSYLFISVHDCSVGIAGSDLAENT